MTEGGSGVALVGFMGSGKTTVGRLLAQRLGWPLVDLDEVLVARHGPIALQIARDGLGTFRDRERDEALRWCVAGPRVLATGGGTFVDPVVRQALCTSYHTVHLDAPLDVIGTRVGAGEGRPLWDGDVARRFDTRRPMYAEAAVRIDTSTLRPEDVVDAILSTFRSMS